MRKLALLLALLLAGCATSQYGEHHVWENGKDPVDATFRILNTTKVYYPKATAFLPTTGPALVTSSDGKTLLLNGSGTINTNGQITWVDPATSFFMFNADDTFFRVFQGAALESVNTHASAPPTCAAATGACALTADSTNNKGQMQLTGGTLVTTITLTFSAAGTWFVAPRCGFFDGNASITPLEYSAGAVSTSTAVVDFAAVAAANINYMCL